MAYPSPLRFLIEQFARFPGIGEKTAQRFVFFLLRQPQADLIRFARALMELHDSIIVCKVCFNYAEKTPCEICADPARDHETICVVAFSHEVSAFERTGEYRGDYHVLGGNVNILDGITPDKLRIKELVERITHSEKKVREVILAFNPDLEGESTGLYLYKLLAPYGMKLTRLARGLPRGADIEYADEITLADAIKARREV
ncbi:MAG: recombination mediator RecR [bacterium]|nr:recombination mediator RecR [bacterium]